MDLPVTPRRWPHASAALAAMLFCAACSKPEPPSTDRPPEPQADAADPGATALRDRIQAPIARAKAVQGQVDDAAAKERADVDAQTGY